MELQTFRNGLPIALEIIEGIDFSRDGPTGSDQYRNPADRRKSAHESDLFPELSPNEFRALRIEPLSLARAGEDTHTRLKNGDEILVREGGELKILTRLLTVRFIDTADEQACTDILEGLGLEVRRRLRFAPNLFLVYVPKGIALGVSEARLMDEHRPPVQFAEAVLAERLHPRQEKRESNFSKQWQWEKVNAEEAWLTTKGNGISVAVIDRGFRWRHPLLAPAVDRALSVSFFKDLSHSHDLNRMPEFSHGTFCAAQVGARQRNTKDVSGVAPETSLMLVCTPYEGETYLPQLFIAMALSYAVSPQTVDPTLPAKGADVVSCAEGPESGEGKLDGVLAAAFEFARGHDVPVFWAVANEPTQIQQDEMVAHPALIRVGSSNALDEAVFQCARGPELDFLAPGEGGVNIAIMVPESGQGTSYATPIAAGIAALALAENPGLGAEDIRALMRAECRKVCPLSDANPRHERYGSGIVDAAAVVKAAVARRDGERVADGQAVMPDVGAG